MKYEYPEKQEFIDQQKNKEKKRKKKGISYDEMIENKSLSEWEIRGKEKWIRHNKK